MLAPPLTGIEPASQLLTCADCEADHSGDVTVSVDAVEAVERWDCPACGYSNETRTPITDYGFEG